MQRHSPLGVKISALPYKENEKVINMPFYNTAKLEKILLRYFQEFIVRKDAEKITIK
jgi:hypothetical protein